MSDSDNTTPRKASKAVIRHDFWFGDDVRAKDAPVYPETMTFAQLVRSHLPPEIVDLTYEDYAHLPKTEQARYKYGKYITACTFDKPRRLNVNADKVNLIILDIDDPQEVSKILSVGKRGSLALTEAAQEVLDGYPCWIYTTFSASRDRLKVRVIVEADPEQLNASMYIAAVRSLAKRLGVQVDKRSEVVSQAMFLPRHTSDGFFSSLETFGGVPFGLSDVAKGLSVPGEGRSGDEAAGEGYGEGGGVWDAEKVLAAFAAYEQPLEVEGDEIKEALGYLDPDMEYPEWIEVGMALHHQFDGSDAGLDLWDGWSAGGSKYAGFDDIDAMWRSFDRRMKREAGGRVVTLRTLLFKAREAGWRGSEKGLPVSDLRDKLRACKSERDLDEVAAEIRGSTHVSDLSREVLVGLFVEQYQEITGHKLTRGVVQKKLKRERDEDEYKIALEPLTDEWIHIALTDEFFYIPTRRVYAFAEAATRMAPKIQSLLVKAGLYEKGASMRRDTAMEFYRMYGRSVDNLLFRPGEDVLFEEDGRLYLNNWDETKLAPAIPAERWTAEEAAAVFTVQQHFEYLIADERERELVLDYLSYTLKEPQRRVQWALMIQGAQGCGKTVIADMMRGIMGGAGTGYVKSVDGTALTKANSNFNTWLIGARLVTFEEVYIQGHRHDVVNATKSILTNETVTIERKGKDSYETKNVTNFMLFTNYEAALPLDNNDRRYFIIKSILQTSAQVLEVAKTGHFDRLFYAIRNYPGAIRGWLEGRSYSREFNPQGHAPMTEAKRVMIDAAKPETMRVAEWLLAEIQEDTVGDKAPISGLLMGSHDLVKLLAMPLEFGGYGQDYSGRQNSTALSRVIQESGFVKIPFEGVSEVAVTVGGVKQRRSFYTRDLDYWLAMSDGDRRDVVRTMFYEQLKRAGE